MHCLLIDCKDTAFCFESVFLVDLFDIAADLWICNSDAWKWLAFIDI